MYTGGAGDGGGFQRNSESAPQESQVNASQPYKCKAVSSLLHMQHEPISLCQVV